MPLSFEPWPVQDKEDPKVVDVLPRVHRERGQLFRNITEASLQEEIDTEGDHSPEQSSSEDEDEDEQAKSGELVSREQLRELKLEMHKQVAVANNEIMMALDFISLLESEHAPQGQKSMSQMLKTVVTPKSLGTDIWERMPVDEARKAQDRLLAGNVKMRSLQQSANDLLGAAKRLEDNVRKETQFWDQMLSISSKGWSICRQSNKKLGVRYGFSESGAEFSTRSVASLTNNADGSISLDRGFGSKPTGLRVTVIRDGQMAGRSYLPSIADDSETTLEARIRHARDSIFDEELFREMTRESRTLSSLGVKMRGQIIKLPTSSPDEPSNTEIHLDLAPLDEETGTQINPSNPDDIIAQAMALAARLTLSQAHRDKLKQRSEVPPPMAERNEEEAVMSILKPLISFLIHKSSLEATNHYLDKITATLSRAKIDVKPFRATFQLPDSAQITSAEQLVSTLQSPFISTAQLELKTPSTTDSLATQVLTITISTSLTDNPNMTSNLTLTAPDSKPLHFSTIEDLAESTDAALSSALAAALGSQADGNWGLDRGEGLLVQEDGDSGDRKSVLVTVDSAEERVILSATAKELVWGDKNEGPEQGFWEGWKEIA